MSGNEVARCDPKIQALKEWDLPPGHYPHGVLMDLQDIEIVLCSVIESALICGGTQRQKAERFSST